MQDTLPERILVDISLDEESVHGRPQDPLYWRGNMDFLVGETLLHVGPFPGALLILPSIEALADGVARVRRDEHLVEVLLVGDSPSMWLAKRKGGKSTGVAIVYQDGETQAVPVRALDV